MRDGTSPERSADEQRFLALVNSNAVNHELLLRLPVFALPDCHLVAGCLFQTVWNRLSAKPPDEGILDYDIFYCDPEDVSWEAEDAAIRRVRSTCRDLGVEVQVRNQARVHLWYEAKFGVACPPIRSSREGIDHFLNRSSCVGVRCDASQVPEVYAPFGFEDLFAMVVRPNRRRELPEIYERKARRWSECWPTLRVVPWADAVAQLD